MEGTRAVQISVLHQLAHRYNEQLRFHTGSENDDNQKRYGIKLHFPGTDYLGIKQFAWLLAIAPRIYGDSVTHRYKPRTVQ
jgi:hypothetical protein